MPGQRRAKIAIGYSVGNRFLEKQRLQAVLPLCRGKLLDVGCGGNNLVRNYGSEGIGVDVHDWPGVDVVVEDSAHLDCFQAEEFDTVTFLACLNHIPYREEALKEAWRLLKPGGRIIITMISRGLGEFWHKITSPFWGEDKKREIDPGEAGGLDRTEVEELLKHTDFVLLETHHFELRLNTIYVGGKPRK